LAATAAPPIARIIIRASIFLITSMLTSKTTS
jgi:hypothetical protein